MGNQLSAFDIAELILYGIFVAASFLMLSPVSKGDDAKAGISMISRGDDLAMIYGRRRAAYDIAWLMIAAALMAMMIAAGAMR